MPVRGPTPLPGWHSLAVAVLVVVTVFVVMMVARGLLPPARGIDHGNELRRVLLDVLLAVLATEPDESAGDDHVHRLAHVAAKFVLAHRAGLEGVVIPLRGDDGIVE